MCPSSDHLPPHACGVVSQSSPPDVLPSAVPTVETVDDDLASDEPPALYSRIPSCSPIVPPVVETIDDDSVCEELPPLHSRMPSSPSIFKPPVVETVDDDATTVPLSSDDDDDSLLDLFDHDDSFGINAVKVDISGMPSTDDVLLDDGLADDPALDVDDADFCHPMTCRCCTAASLRSPIDEYLFDAAVNSPHELARKTAVHQVFDDDGQIHEYTVDEIRHHDYEGPRAHLDDGAQATTTHKQEHLFGYRVFSADAPCRTRLVSADGHRYVPIGYGILRVPAPNSLGYIPVFCLHTPEIKSCIISPSTIERLLPPAQHHGTTLNKYPASGVFTFTVNNNLRTSENVTINGILDAGLCYTQPLLLPEQSSTSAQEKHVHTLGVDFDDATIESEFKLHKLSVRSERLLWHQRLGHCSDNYLYNAHNHILGVPSFKHHDPVLEQCPTCLAAKMKKRAPGHASTMKATTPWQGLSIDFAFTGQASKDKSRAAAYKGFNGETSFVLVKDHYTGTLDGTTRISKGAPVNWLRQFLVRRSPQVQDKYVHMDQGGELYNNPKIRALFREFGYDIYPTGADSSHQNGPVERAHETIGDALRTLLNGSNLDPRFWTYAFYFYLRIKNALPGKDDSLSYYERLHGGAQPDLASLRTFGCRVWVRPPGKRSSRLKNHAKRGIFLGFLPNTTKNILWFDPETNRVKIAFHVRFDEGMNDLPLADVPPNVRHLQRVQDGAPIPSESDDTVVPPFGLTSKPFLHEVDETLKVACDESHFGFRLHTDTATQRVYIGDIAAGTSAAGLRSSLRATQRKYVGAFITSIDDVPVFTLAQAHSELSRLRALAVATFRITLAPEPLPTRREQAAALDELDLLERLAPSGPDHNDLALTMDSLRAIHALRVDPDSTAPPLSNDEIELLISALSSEAVTDEERALGTFTRRKLKTLPTWSLWHLAEKKQLDQFESLGMYGKPCVPPPGAIILRSHWQYRVKTSGKRRSRQCCDGSARAAPRLHAMAETYASCIEQPVFRLFLALSASLNYQIYGGDAQDAFAHSPAPTVPTFVAIDDAYSDWYFDKYGIRLARGLVLPVLHALQGHPEAARLWEEHINIILKEFDFKSTTHEKNIYQATIKGVKVLLCRQVDDFSIASPDPAIAAYIYERIGQKLQLPGETEPPFVDEGLVESFNGVDILQTQDYIKLSCSTYIRRLLASHSWSTPGKTERPIGSRPFEPFPESDLQAIYTTPGFAEHTSEHSALAKEMGFSYRTLLGELLYAYITARPDIGYAIATLAKFSTAPSKLHYQRLKGVALYLRHTVDWGIIYWRPAPCLALPHVPLTLVECEAQVPPFPPSSSPFQLRGFVDASHANDLRNRRSTTGYGFLLACGVVAYRCHTQTITATSSTEAEFLAAVEAAKIAKYLRSILRELGFPQDGPTPIYEDNESTIKMVNAGRPTVRSRHIDIQHFAIQDWKQAGDIHLIHIPGIINPADCLTKPVAWILHSRHARRLMGHYGADFPVAPSA